MNRVQSIGIEARTGWLWPGVRRAGATMLLLTSLAAPMAATLAVPMAAGPADAQPRAGAAVPPGDLLSLIPGSSDNWSVSNTNAGCYVLSPRQKGNSSLVIGWRSQHQLGLFLVGFALAVPVTNVGEPVLIQAGGQPFAGSGQMIGVRQLFVPIDDEEMQSILRELSDTGTLWVEIRHTWIAHGGRGLVAALADYRKICATGGGAH